MTLIRTQIWYLKWYWHQPGAGVFSAIFRDFLNCKGGHRILILAIEVPLFGMWKRLILQKVAVFWQKEWHFWCPNRILRSLSVAQNAALKTLDWCVYHFWAHFGQITYFRLILGGFHLLKCQKNSNWTLGIIYSSIVLKTCFLGCAG